MVLYTQDYEEAVTRMGFFKDWGSFMVEGSRSFARWEVENARIIMGDK
jgi:hypothetical protein